jgi:hypothetical protein
LEVDSVPHDKKREEVFDDKFFDTSSSCTSSPSEPPAMLALVLALGLGSTDINCNIFDETMVCDNERARLRRAEIRTCSG